MLHLCQQLLLPCQTKLLVSIVDHSVMPSVSNKKCPPAKSSPVDSHTAHQGNRPTGNCATRKPVVSPLPGMAVVQDRQMPGYSVLGLCRAVELERRHSGVHVFIFDGRQHTVCTSEQSGGLLMELKRNRSAAF